MPQAGKPKKFYVYRLFDDPAVTLYIGKGCGNRLAAQKRKWRAQGEVMEWCTTEKEAFRREVELIAKFHPTENKHPGGQGGRVGCQSIVTEMERHMILVGPRRHVARELLRFDLSGHLSAADIEKIHSVATGPYC